MPRQFSILWVHLVCLLAVITRHAAFSKGIGRRALLYSVNDTALLASETLVSPFPYFFPESTNVDNLFPMPDCSGVTLEEATVDQLQDAMNRGKLTSVMIALCYLQRVEQTDDYIK